MDSFKLQIDLQQEVLFKVDLETSSFKIIESSDSQLLSIDGAFDGILEKNYSCKWIKLNEGWAIRAGGLGNVLTE